MSFKIVAVAVLALGLAGCAQTVSGQGSGSSAPHPSSSSASSPAPGKSSGFPRYSADTEFGDPPLVDVCKTLGTALFRSSGYYAAVPDGQRAASCEYFLNTSPASALARPQLYADFFVDQNSEGGGYASSSIGTFGLDVSAPKKAGDPCVNDVLTTTLDVDIQIGPGSATPSTKTLCALAHAGAARVAAVMTIASAIATSGDGLVQRQLAANSLTTQNLCDAVDSTAARSFMTGREYQLGFGTACRYKGTDFEWWVELRFGVQPGNVASTTVHIGGHVFAADLDSAGGYCRYRWQGPAVRGASDSEQVTIKRSSLGDAGKGVSCTDVGLAASQIITALGRH